MRANLTWCYAENKNNFVAVVATTICETTRFKLAIFPTSSDKLVALNDDLKPHVLST